MKLSRIIATGAILALAGGSSILAATTATAAPTTTNYVTASQFTAETSPYAASWFKGDSTPATTVTDSLSGLVVNGQILNGDTPTTGLTNLVDGAKFNVASGTANFQVSVFANAAPAARGFTNLYPVAAGVLTGQWVTTRDLLADNGSVAYPASSTATLAQFQEALGADYTILAYGAFVNPSATATISSITWNGVTSQFTPKSTVTPATASLTVAQFAKGITVKFTGFVPGESVQPGIGSGQSGDTFGDPIVADATGAVTVNFVKASAIVGSTYTLGAFAAASGINAPVTTVTVVADGTTVATPATPVKGNASFTG